MVQSWTASSDSPKFHSPMESGSARAAAGLIAVAAALRCAAVACGIGQTYLSRRIEVSTPANGLLPLREGVALLNMGASPFQGATSHTPPLLLWSLAGIAQHPLLHAAPHVAADLLAGCLFRSVMLHAAGAAADHAAARANAALAIYCFNPFSVLACIAGTSTALENLCVVAALFGAMRGSVLITSLSIASGAYLGLHPLLLLVPLAVVLAGRQRQRSSSSSSSNSGSKGRDDPQPLQQQESHLIAAAYDDDPGQAAGVEAAAQLSNNAEAGHIHVVTTCFRLALATAFMLLLLVAGSDALLSEFPDDRCLPRLVAQLAKWQAPAAGRAEASSFGEDAPGGCWATHVYGLQLLVRDLTPNIGQWWYFFAEVFPQQRLFFCFVAHAMCGMFVVPLALRFPQQGTLLLVTQVGINTMLRPYPSVGDLGLYLSLLPLMHQQLRRLRIGLLLCNSLLLLAVLGPAMWTQWINVESANSNFFYSITLCMGAWHTLLLAQLLLINVQGKNE